MFDTLEDHYRWDTVHQVFVLLERPGLVDVRPHRVDVQAARVGAGWELMTTVHTEENAQPAVVDVWIRAQTVDYFQPG